MIPKKNFIPPGINQMVNNQIEINESTDNIQFNNRNIIEEMEENKF